MIEGTQARLDQLADDLRGAVARQRGDSAPAHEDFSTWGWALSELTALLDQAAGMLAQQVAGYGQRQLLRDDEHADPYDRLRTAADHLATFRTHVAAAGAAARNYHSAIGHIAVEVDPQ